LLIINYLIFIKEIKIEFLIKSLQQNSGKNFLLGLIESFLAESII
jgi:hypothetical protein